MITTAKQILNLAKAQIGITEYPPGSNKVKYNTAYYGTEVSGSAYPWCCTFIWWLFRQQNSEVLFYGGGKTASCTTLMRYYKQHSQFHASAPQPGDLVFFNFDGNPSDAEHIGIVEAINGNIIITIEGNTGTANDANGGAVMRRERRSNVILGYATPLYATEQARWQEKNGRFWYRHPDCSYTKNGWEQIDGVWYHFDAEGWMQTGWLEKQGKWYYLKPDGAMAVNELLTIESPVYGKETYAFGDDGRMLVTDACRGRLL